MRRPILTVLAAVAAVCALGASSSGAAPRDTLMPPTDLSAQATKFKRATVAPRPAAKARVAPRAARVTTRPAARITTRPTARITSNRAVNRSPAVNTNRFTARKTFNANRARTLSDTRLRSPARGLRTVSPVGRTGLGRRLGPVGPANLSRGVGPSNLTRAVGRAPLGGRANLGRVAGARGPMAGLGAATLINNRRVAIFRQPRSFWRGNTMIRLIAVGTLGAIVVGGLQYYPDGYVMMPRPACSGITPEGCSLRWQAVPTMEGGSEAQCVQFCPQGRAAMLEQRVSEMAPQPVAVPGPGAAPLAQGCEISIFAAPNFTGDAARTNDSQPNLNEQWERQIASVQVLAGTWDFFKAEDYNGEAMRLGPGEYRDLGPWTKQISSFMCSEPGQ